MNVLFADTSYYLAIVNPSDVSHSAAVDISHRYRGRVVTTEYILIELGNLLARGADRSLFVELVKRLQADPETVIISSRKDLFDQALTLYAKRLDKSWSLTDCISFVVMQQHDLTDALTGDRHFEQAGFRALLARVEK